MDIFDIMEYLIFGAMGLLFLWAVYTFIKYFKEILFGILKFIKYEITSSIIFLPISVLIWVINKKIYSRIYDADSDVYDDNEYESEKALSINFKEFQKFICIKSAALNVIRETINNCIETTPNINFGNIKYHVTNNKTILTIEQNCSFYNYHYLIQWLDTCLPNTSKNEVYGLAINQTDPNQTYYVISDKTGKHINSLTGKTLKGEKFSINLLNDLEKYQSLEINNKIKLDRDLDISLLLIEVKNLSFKATTVLFELSNKI